MPLKAGHDHGGECNGQEGLFPISCLSFFILLEFSEKIFFCANIGGKMLFFSFLQLWVKHTQETVYYSGLFIRHFLGFLDEDLR